MVLSIVDGRKKLYIAITCRFWYNSHMIQQKTILILPTGKVLAFTVAALATTYQQAYGGTIIPTGLVNYSKDGCQLALDLV